ncbi:MAG: DUF3710 domain-containing protein [Actinomycetaceae bacterium]|nr:DUF3710 domain-containing protein [Actinomycetaceae bacterium]
MGWFRRSKASQNKAIGDEGAAPGYAAAEESGEDETKVTKLTSVPSEDFGPYDASQRDTSQGYLDFGALYLPSVPGVQIQPEFGADGSSINRLGVVVGSSRLNIMVAASPTTGGSWDRVRQKTLESVANEGVKAREVKGRWGTEIQAASSGTTPDGRKVKNFIRIVGVEGPRWVLRIDIQGPAAVEEAAFNQVSEIIDNIVVYRDKSPRPPESVIALTLPQELIDKLH